MLKRIIAFNFLVGMLIIALPPYRIVYTRPPEVIQASTQRVMTINEEIAYYASKYNVSANTMHLIIKCESGYKIGAVGDGGTSFGLSQIHLPSNPQVTKAQALNQSFAIEFLAKGLSKGQASKWTCARILNVV